MTDGTINSIINEVTEISFFADDTAIVDSGKTQMIVKEFSKDVQSINDWCNVNKLSINTDKSKLMAFGKNYRIAKFQVLAKLWKIWIVLNIWVSKLTKN